MRTLITLISWSHNYHLELRPVHFGETHSYIGFKMLELWGCFLERGGENQILKFFILTSRPYQFYKVYLANFYWWLRTVQLKPAYNKWTYNNDNFKQYQDIISHRNGKKPPYSHVTTSKAKELINATIQPLLFPSHKDDSLAKIRRCAWHPKRHWGIKKATSAPGSFLTALILRGWRMCLLAQRTYCLSLSHTHLHKKYETTDNYQHCCASSMYSLCVLKLQN